MKMKKLLSVLAVLVLASACVKKAKQTAPAKAAPSAAPRVETLTKSEEDRFRLPVVKKFNDALDPVLKTVQQEQNRELACKGSLELDEIAARMTRLELPKSMEHQEADWSRSVGELRASVMMFAALCMNTNEQELSESFEPIPSAFAAVLEVVGAEEEAPMTAEVTPAAAPAEAIVAQ